jgi:hypothetical protein
MISIQFDDKVLFKDLTNILGYSEGFLQGVKEGENNFANKIAKNAIEILKAFVDQNARVDPQMYHHIYEWYQEGHPEARLFDIEYSSVNGGISFHGTFSQSSSIANGATVPFYNKAEIMEKGIPIVIKPVNANVLNFKVGTEDVFTSKPINIQHPGGTHVMGSFEHIFKLFFEQHFTQSVLKSTGIFDHLQKITDYKDNLKSAKIGGRAKGVEVGYNWITKAGELSV